MLSAGLYIHIPFCIQRCTYCDFYSCVAAKNAKLFSPYQKNETFVRQILADFRYLKQRFAIDELSTIYIGGGTPSLLGCEDIISLGTTINHTQTNSLQEFTIEANPEDITAELLDSWQAAGIRRVSVGVQSFDNTVLQNVHRRGSKQKTLAALDLLFTRNFKVSLDLIAGLPGHTEKLLQEDIAIALSYQPSHISLYELSDLIDISSKKYANRADLFMQGVALLQTAEYHRYEVSNFARDTNSESLHNKLYWHLESYLGIAPAAVGTVIKPDYSQGLRFSARNNMEQWLTETARETVYNYEELDRAMLLEESLMMGFRLFEGISRSEFQRRFKRDIISIVPTVFERYEARGMCTITSESVRLNEKGMQFLNQFLIDIFAKL